MVVYTELFGDEWRTITWLNIAGRIIKLEAKGATRAAALRAIADVVDKEEQRVKEVDDESSVQEPMPEAGG